MATGPLRYDRELYQAGTSQLVFTDKEARAEYARLRKAANKRLAVLEKAGYGGAASLRNYPASFESMRGASERDVRKGLSEVARFLSLKTTTLRGIQATQKKALATLHSHGYDFVNKSNLESFGRFMEAARQHSTSRKAFDSDRVAKYFRDYEDEILASQEEGEDMMDQWEELEDYEPEEPDETERVQQPEPKKQQKTKPKKRQPASERWKKRAEEYERYRKGLPKKRSLPTKKRGRRK